MHVLSPHSATRAARVAPERQFSGWSCRADTFSDHLGRMEQQHMTDVSAGSGLALEALARDIKARIERGDRETEKAEQHYRSAGIHLLEAKDRIEAGELPGERWFTWSCRATGYGPDRVEQLLRIGRGETTQSALNAASAASHRNAYQRSPSYEEALRAAEEILRECDAPEQSFSQGIRERMDASRSATAERDECAHTSRPQTAAERQSQRRLRLRASRVEAGADLPPPLAPIDHRRVLKEGRAILGCLDFDQLKVAVAALQKGMGRGEKDKRAAC